MRIAVGVLGLGAGSAMAAIGVAFFIRTVLSAKKDLLHLLELYVNAREIKQLIEQAGTVD